MQAENFGGYWCGLLNDPYEPTCSGRLHATRWAILPLQSASVEVDLPQFRRSAFLELRSHSPE
jgi:hypothetical protein